MTNPANVPLPGGDLPELEDAAEATGMPPEAVELLRGATDQAELRRRLEEADRFARDVREQYDLPELAPTFEEAEARAAANRYLLALRSVRREADLTVAELKATVADLERRHEEKTAGLVRRAEWLLTALRMLARWFTFPGKAKSLKLLAGRVGYRLKPAKWTILDSERLTTWAQMFAPAIVTTPEPKPFVAWRDLQAWAEAHREEADRLAGEGLLAFEREDDQFYATPEEPA